MTRSEREKVIRPIILKCQQFVESRHENLSDAFADPTPDVRRVSLIFSLAHTLLGDSVSGNGLEIGSGHGYLLFSMAVLLPGIRWFAVDHPGRDFVRREAYRQAFNEHNCSLAIVDIIRDPLPFPDAHFSLVTFSEVLEHLPVERVNFVLSEIVRVVQAGGILIASSPNQASLENRVRLLKGRSILDMPDEVGYAQGTFGHIRLYTVAEVNSAMAKRGFILERSVVESNNSGYRGTSNGSWRGRAHFLYEQLERRTPVLRPMGDTWYMAFRKAVPA
jgi:SAM-dependent methyltransferase